MTSTNKALMVSEALKTASLYRNTYVFGGYIRDVLLHGNSVEELHDLDLFFQCGRDINSFENIFSIFHELVEKDYEGDKEKYGDTRKVIKFTYKNTHGGGNLTIDCVYPLMDYQQDDAKPIDIEHLDFDINAMYQKLDANQCTIELVGGMNNMCRTQPLPLTRIISRIRAKSFSSISSPFHLARGNGRLYKASACGKAMKLLLRANNLVKRGWKQDGITKTGKTPTKTYWHVHKMVDGKIEFEGDAAAELWRGKETWISGEKTCTICKEEFGKEDIVFIPPCGHKTHVCCADYIKDPESGTSFREETGIVGWFAKQRTNCIRSMDDMYTELEQILKCPMCNEDIFESVVWSR